MSAILGRINFNNAPIDRDQFGSAFAALSQYGRDRAVIWHEAHIALGQHLLELTPESKHEKQPTTIANAVIVADARIDNRNELFERFAIASNRRCELPDSHLILHAYHLWGERCTEHLLGDFAFAIWNKSTQELLCARDHIGARPLYFSNTTAGFVFATDIRALQQFHDVDMSIDELEVARYLISDNPPQRTFLRNISILQPAHHLVVSASKFRQQRHWTPDDAPEVRYRAESNYIEHFRNLLEKAVADRVRTAHPVGSHLSGGLDSSGIAVLAQRELKKRNDTLHMVYSWSPPRSAVYPSNKNDERDLIDQVCTREGLSRHYPTVTTQDFLDFLNRDMASEGTTDVFEEFAIMRHASKEGIRLMLSGWGGDEAATFNGRGYLAYLLKTGQILRLLEIMRRESRGLRNLTKIIRPLFFQSCVVPLLPNVLYDRFDANYRSDPRQRFISPQLKNAFLAVEDVRSRVGREVADPRKVMSALLTSGHLARRMETWASWSSAYRIIYTYPLTDRRILDFVMGMPRALVYQRGHWRYAFRAALNDIMPRELIWRRLKVDAVNEKKRLDLCLACWDRLSSSVQTGWDEDDNIPWLDDVTLRKSIKSVPAKFTVEELNIFQALVSAVRVRNMWKSRISPAG